MAKQKTHSIGLVIDGAVSQIKAKKYEHQKARLFFKSRAFKF